MGEGICKLCGAIVHGSTQAMHEAIDEWLLQKILFKHPGWKQSDGACPRCVDAIKNMKKEFEAKERV